MKNIFEKCCKIQRRVVSLIHQLNAITMTTNKTKKEVPAHIKMIAAKMEANAKKFGYVIEDITPKGYGPDK